MGKKTIVVIFGGQSSEHEVSCMSAANVIKRIDTEKFETVLIGITKEGRWLKAEDLKSVKNGSWRESKIGAILSPDASEKCVIFREKPSYTKVKVDVVFPVLHGLYGEDGTIQGLLELSGIPYVGCSVAASALAMDKFFTKIIADSIGVKQAEYETAYASQIKTDCHAVVERVEKHFKYPVFVKPSRSGSSCGVGKANNKTQLAECLKEAVFYDSKILIEEMIYGREIECAVISDEKERAVASGVGEILAAADFYDYDAKYFNGESKTVTDPDIPKEAVEEIRQTAVRIFNAIDGFGLARVDFFLTEDGEVVFNEINTMPGFTDISMFPSLWARRGMDSQTLITRLIDLAFKRKKI